MPTRSFREENKLFKQARDMAKKYSGRNDFLDIQFGLKKIENNLTNDLSIRFHVKKKKAKNKLKANELIPGKIGKFKTDVIEYKPKLQTVIVEPFVETRPVLGGIEIQSDLFNQRTNWGTIGCSLSFNDVLFGITNYHVVFGGLNEDQVNQHVNQLLLFQPNKPNFGTEIGLVGSAFSQKLDYCLFRLKENPNSSQAINRINGIVSGFANPLIGQKLAKVGAATNLTFGIVEARSLVDISKIIIRFAPDPGNESPKISNGGDSGSVWFTGSPGEPEKLKLVALHFGGDVVKNIAFANLFSSIIPSINQKIKL